MNIHSRVELLEKFGAEDVEVITFSKEFSALSPSAFIEDILLGLLNAAHVVVGENFSFGARASGSISDIRKYIEADAVALLHDEHGPISSTRIRHHVAEGEMEAARVLLGRPHFLQGEVVHGEKRGREIGYPTANLEQLIGMAIPPTEFMQAIYMWSAIAYRLQFLSVPIQHFHRRTLVNAPAKLRRMR